MNVPVESPREPERPIESRLLDVLIRAALVFALAFLCFQVFAPFLTLMVWALILAVAIYPLHRRLARRLGGRQGLAATLIVLLAAVVIVAPTAALMSHFGDSVRDLVHGARNNTLQIPPPRAGVETWPIVGKKLHAAWSQAHTDLPAVVANLQPKIGDLARAALGMVASIAGGVLLFLAAFIIAGIIMAFGEAGARSAERIFARIVGPRARHRVREALHRDDPRRGAGRHRRRADPGHRHRPDTARRRRSFRRGARAHRPGAGHRADSGTAGDHPRDHLHLGERRLRQRSRRSSTRSSSVSAASPTTSSSR